MWMPAVTTVQPVREPVLAADAAAYLVAPEDAGGASAAAVAARSHVETVTGLRLITQTVRIKAGSFADLERFQVAPIRSIVSITYRDGATGANQVLDPAVYELFGDGVEWGVRPAFNRSWPSVRAVDDAIVVTVIAGYGDEGTAVPPAVIRAILLLSGDFYENREDTVIDRGLVVERMPNGVLALLQNFRV